MQISTSPEPESASAQVSYVVPTPAATAWQYGLAPADSQAAAQRGDSPGTHLSAGVALGLHAVPPAHALPRNEPSGKHASSDKRHE